MPTVSPTERVGKYVSPREWNALISDPDTVSYTFSYLVFHFVGNFQFHLWLIFFYMFQRTYKNNVISSFFIIRSFFPLYSRDL